jgi:hypothetical protein
MSTIKLLESAPTKFQKVGDASGVLVIFLNHLAAVLDNFDPRILGGLAAISTGEPS